MCFEHNYLINTTHLVNTKDIDLGITGQYMQAKIGIDLKSVFAWRESFDDQGIPDGTIVYAGSDSFYIQIMFPEFVRMIRNFNNENDKSRNPD